MNAINKLDVDQLIHDPVARTLLIPLGYRALENQHPDPILRDPYAAVIAQRIDFTFDHLGGQGLPMLSSLLRAKFIDRVTTQFLASHPRGVVVDIGCGLDTRFQRVDNGQVRWFNLDLPEVIDLRRRLIEEPTRCQTIARSALDTGWMDDIRYPRGEAYLFIAEGIFPYLEEESVRKLILTLCQNFPGSQIVFDSMAPQWVMMGRLNPALKGFQARIRWGLPSSQEIERWAPGIHLLEEMDYFTQPEPRMERYRWMQLIPIFSRSTRVGYYQLGDSA